MSIPAHPGQPFTAVAEGFPSGLANTLTFGVRKLPEGTLVVPATTGGIVEFVQGGGLSNYQATRTMPADAVVGGDYKTAWPDDLVDEQEDIDVTIPLQATASVGAPIDVRGVVTLVRGDDYLAVDGRALEWTVAGAPSLLGATVTFKASKVDGAASLSKAATVLNATSARAELVAADTRRLPVGEWRCSLEATLTDASHLTLVRAKAVVRRAP